jgi:putative glutamine amidotransferase
LTKPLVLIPACNRQLGAHPNHIVGRKYVDAVWLAGCQPLVVPGATPADVEALLDLADGVFLTGSPSNVDPRYFGEAVRDPALPLDVARDDWTLPLIPAAIARGVPLFGVCRGFQEMNVALGGTLHQAVHEVGPYHDHREDDSSPIERQYGPAHPVEIVPGGMLEPLLGSDGFEVNSLHGQGVNRLAEGLRVEARASDGLIEAFSATGAASFALGVQWHPEWQADTNPISMRLLEAFGQACESRRQSRTLLVPNPR